MTCVLEIVKRVVPVHRGYSHDVVTKLIEHFCTEVERFRVLLFFPSSRRVKRSQRFRNLKGLMCFFNLRSARLSRAHANDRDCPTRNVKSRRSFFLKFTTGLVKQKVVVTMASRRRPSRRSRATIIELVSIYDYERYEPQINPVGNHPLPSNVMTCFQVNSAVATANGLDWCQQVKMCVPFADIQLWRCRGPLSET
jgi:hypothetical protein